MPSSGAVTLTTKESRRRKRRRRISALGWYSHLLCLIDALEIIPVLDEAGQQADHLGAVERVQQRGVHNAVQLEATHGEDGAVHQQLSIHNFRHFVLDYRSCSPGGRGAMRGLRTMGFKRCCLLAGALRNERLRLAPTYSTVIP